MFIQFFFLVFFFILPFLQAGTSQGAKLLFFLLPFIFLLLYRVEGEEEQKAKTANNRIFLLWLAFLVSALISVFFSVSWARSVPAFFELLAIFFLSTFGSFIFVKKKAVRFLGWTILAVGFLLTLGSFYYLIPGVKPPTGDIDLLYAHFGHNHLSDYLLFCLPISLLLLTRKGTTKKSSQVLLFIIFIIYLLGFVVSLARGAWLVFLIFPILLWLVDQKAFISLKNKILVFLPIIASIFCLLVLLFLGLKLTFDKEIKARQDWFGRQFLKATNWEKRPGYWYQAFRLFEEHPLVGAGLNTFYLGSLKHQKNPRNYSAFTHNFPLQILSETGIFGFLFFSLLIGLLIYGGFKNVRKQEDIWLSGLWLGGTLSFLHALIDYDWNLPAIFLTSLVCLQISRGNDYSDNKSVGPGRILNAFSLLLLIFGISEMLSLFFYSQARALEQNNKLSGAGKNYARAVFFYPWNIEIQKKVIEFAFEYNLNSVPVLVDDWSKIFGQDPDVYQWLVQEYKRKGNNIEAKKYLKMAIWLHPLQLDSWVELMDWQSTSQDKRKIFFQLEKTIRNVSNFDIYHRAWGKALWRMSELAESDGDIKQAIEYGQKSILIDPWTIDYYLRIKDLYLKENDLDGASGVIINCRVHFALEDSCIKAQEQINQIKQDAQKNF